MALTIVTAPGEAPVTLEEAKAYCRIDTTDFDELIQAFINAATDHLDGKMGWLQRCLSPQTWELAYDAFPCNGTSILIPLPPLLTVDSVKYDDGDGIEQTLDPDNYYVDNKSVPGWVVPVYGFNWPTVLRAVNSVRITFTAGYDEDASGNSGVPESIKLAIKIMVADMFENRESVTPGNANKVEIPTTAERLLSIYDPRVFA